MMEKKELFYASFEEKKILIHLSFRAVQLVMFEFKTFGKKLFFLATSLGFLCF